MQNHQNFELTKGEFRALFIVFIIMTMIVITLSVYIQGLTNINEMEKTINITGVANQELYKEFGIPNYNPSKTERSIDVFKCGVAQPDQLKVIKIITESHF